MEVWEGYRFFRENKGKIYKAELEEGHHGTTYIIEDIQFLLFSPHIGINKNDSLEEQVITLIHELTHLAPKYLRYTACGEELPSELEDEIEKKTLDFYEKEPLFVWYFRKLIQETEEEPSSVYAA